MHVVQTPYGPMVVGKSGRPIALRGLGETFDECLSKCPNTFFGNKDVQCSVACQQADSAKSGGFMIPSDNQPPRQTPATNAPPDGSTTIPLPQPAQVDPYNPWTMQPPAETPWTTPAQNQPPPANPWDQFNPFQPPPTDKPPTTPNPFDPGTWLPPPPAQNQPPQVNPMDPSTWGNVLTPPGTQPGNQPPPFNPMDPTTWTNLTQPPKTDSSGGCPAGSYPFGTQCIPNPLAPPPKNAKCPNGQAYNTLLGGCSQSPPFVPPQGVPPFVTSDGCQPGQYKVPLLGCQGPAKNTTPPIHNCDDGSAPVNGKCPGGKPPNPPNALCPNGSLPVGGKCPGGGPAYTCPDNSFPVGGRCPAGAMPIPVESGSNTTMWIVLGLGVAAIGGGAYLLLRKKKPTATHHTTADVGTPVAMTPNRRRRRSRRY